MFKMDGLTASHRTQALDELGEKFVVRAGVARAAALGMAVRRSGRWEVEVGAAGNLPSGAAASESTPFDLASVSKSFVACCFARLWEKGLVEPVTALGALLPECRATRSEGASLEALLSHRAGLDAHRRLFAPLERGRPVDRVALLREAANATRIPPEAGRELPLYSDLGYLLAGEALCRAAECALDELVHNEIAVPLALTVGSARKWLRRERDFRARVAPTEHVWFRGGELAGEVHDENAWAFAGHGAAGQAGLFGTVHDVLGLGMALVDALRGERDSFLKRSSVEFLLQQRPGGTLRLGFDGKSDEGSSAGPSAGKLTFGHLGFTGTSYWCDPLAESVTVLLTNRVCPTRENLHIRACRPVVHEALFARARTRRA
jgi:CubicO group peptidase (beta-lactamase class C family)